MIKEKEKILENIGALESRLKVIDEEREKTER